MRIPAMSCPNFFFNFHVIPILVPVSIFKLPRKKDISWQAQESALNKSHHTAFG